MFSAGRAGAPWESRASSAPAAAFMQLTHETPVLAVQYEPHRSRLYCGTQGGSIDVWCTHTYSKLFQLQSPSEQPVPVVSLQLVGSMVLAGDTDSVLRAWCTQSRTLLATKELQRGTIYCIATSLQGAVFLGCKDAHVVFSSSADAPHGAVSLPSQEELAAGKDICVHSVRAHAGFVFACTVLTRDDEHFLVTGGGDRELHMLHIPSMATVSTLRGHTGHVNCVVAHPHYPICFSGSSDATVRVWDLDTRTCRRVLAGHSAEVLAVTTMADGALLVSGDAEGVLIVWQTATLAPVARVQETSARVLALESGEERLFVSYGSGAVAMWDAPELLRQHRDSGFPPMPPSSAAQQRYQHHHHHGGAGSAHSPSPSRPDRGHAQTAPGSWGVAATAGHAGGTSMPSDASTPGEISHGSPPATPASHTGARESGHHRPFGAGGGSVAGAPPVGNAPFSVVGPAWVTPPVPQQWATPYTVQRPSTSVPLSGEGMVSTLREFVSIPSVSSHPGLREQCWDAARFVQRELDALGAETALLHADPEVNPVVAGRIASSDAKAPTVLFQGHYDVQPVAEGEAGWVSPAFALTGRNGYLHGRGATDNKGPIVAAISAVQDAMSATADGSPPVNVVFLIEGEGENGSKGFRAVVESPEGQEWLKGVDLILNSNSAWLDDKTPCLIYGLRGLLQLRVTVEGASSDLHSGVDGGVVQEPMHDLVALVSTLTEPSTGHVRVEGFYRDVRPLGPEERALYDGIDFDVAQYRRRLGVPALRLLRPAETQGQDPAELARHCGDPPSGQRRIGELTSSVLVLMTRWREPALSLHAMETSAANASVVPRSATAVLSVRTVPDQSTPGVADAVTAHLRREFVELQSCNKLTVEVVRGDRWWMGDPHSAQFQAMRRALVEHWGVEPNFVREGGTIRTIPYLEGVLGADALAFPMGQASDAAHLPNERIRLLNLVNGRRALATFLLDYASLAHSGGEAEGEDGAKPARSRGSSLDETAGVAHHRAGPMGAGDGEQLVRTPHESSDVFRRIAAAAREVATAGNLWRPLPAAGEVRVEGSEPDYSLRYGEMDMDFARGAVLAAADRLAGSRATCPVTGTTPPRAEHGDQRPVFVDLGSGVGQLVLAAAHTGRFRKCIGVEVVPARHDAAGALLQQFADGVVTGAGEWPSHGARVWGCDVELLCGDLLRWDWGQADVVFCNALVFSEELLQRLDGLAAETMRCGSVFVCQHELPHPRFRSVVSSEELFSVTDAPALFEEALVIQVAGS